jgi:hypothetical protein
MTDDVNVPLDWLHDECRVARDRLREAFARLHADVARWEPTECPPPPAT